MKTLHRLIFNEALIAVFFVALCFLSLFFFFDLLEELPKVGANNTYKLRHAFAYVLLTAPNHLYEILPMTVLIGTIFVMSRLAQSSEFTILRTSGLGPLLALRTLMKLGAIFVLITFFVGDYVAPLCDKQARLLQSQHTGVNRQSGSWLKETGSDQKIFININQVAIGGIPIGLRIFEFTNQGEWNALTNAATADINSGEWLLKGVQRNELDSQVGATPAIKTKNSSEIKWPTDITSEMILASFIKPNRMQTTNLFQYIRHLNANGQTSLKIEIEFWKKIFYPLSCLVMVVIALPYAYLHFRSGNIAAHVFGGVLIGISFFLLNNVFSHIGTINHWTPWLAAAAPSILYASVTLGVFSWLVARQ